MAVANAFYHGKRVSVSHGVILNAYEKKYGTPAQVNQGRRTLAEQAGFYATYLRGGTLAAFPSPNAPHIKANHEHHALDINQGTGEGRAQHVAAFYRSLGIHVEFNVRTEAWHMDTLDEAALKHAAAKLGGATGDPTLKQGQKGPSIVRLKKLLHDNGIRDFSGPPSKPNSNRYDPFFGANTAAAVRRFQRENKLTPDGVVGESTWRALHA